MRMITSAALHPRSALSAEDAVAKTLDMEKVITRADPPTANNDDSWYPLLPREFNMSALMYRDILVSLKHIDRADTLCMTSTPRMFAL